MSGVEPPELAVTRWPRGQFVTVMDTLTDVMKADGAVMVRKGDEVRRGDVWGVTCRPIRNQLDEVVGWERAVRVRLERSEEATR
jgi:hypothetical protein